MHLTLEERTPPFNCVLISILVCNGHEISLNSTGTQHFSVERKVSTHKKKCKQIGLFYGEGF